MENFALVCSRSAHIDCAFGVERLEIGKRSGYNREAIGPNLHGRSLPMPRAASFSSPRNGRHTTKVFKALSDNTRQEILRLLDLNHQCTVGEIVGSFNLSQPTISRHLSVLKEADLVTDERRGQHVLYRLNGMALAASMRTFFGQFSDCQQQLR
jgi:hypothetical protein